MKTTLKTIIGGAALGLALLANSVPTWAGSTFRQEVSITNTVAGGSMTAARYSKDKRQYIQCVNHGDYDGTMAHCIAMNKTGFSRGCVTFNRGMIAVVSTITDSSLISFSTAPGGTQCLEIDVNNGSYNLK